MSSYQPNPQERFTGFRTHSFDERHGIDTPEQIQLQFTLAGIGSRFLAIAVDTGVQVGAGLVFGAVLGGLAFALRGSLPSDLGMWLLAGGIAFYFLLYFGYFVVFEILWSGQTPGKRVIGIRVIKESGRPLSPVEVIGRNLLRIVDQLPSFYVIGIVTALCNSKGKRLGDFVAGSIVVQEKALTGGPKPWEQSEAPIRPMTFVGVKQLPADLMTVVDTFLLRRKELDATTRYRMAQEVLERVGSRLSLTSEQKADPERTLESVSWEYRQ